MKLSILLVLLLVGLVSAHRDVPRHIYRQFVEFETEFDKVYDSPEERYQRLRIFRDNLMLVEDMNEEHENAGGARIFGITKFMDLTPEEFQGQFLTYRPANISNPRQHMLDMRRIPRDPPATMDWRDTTGVITPVKNQEQCGSCWAFSATEAIESAWVLSGKPQAILGPQQIVDCDQTDDGCGGGNTETAYQYVIQAGGQETEQNYPYTGQDGTCRFHSSKIAVTISNWKYVCQSAKQELGNMLDYVGTTGPVSVCVDAAPWQFYNGGVLKTCGMQVDHCVQVVGYDSQNNIDVWLVRNSWGADWGEQGYIYIERGKNLCDIAGDVTVPIV